MMNDTDYDLAQDACDEAEQDARLQSIQDERDAEQEELEALQRVWCRGLGAEGPAKPR